MRKVPRRPVTTAGWSDLVDEFDLWGEADQVATLWWRDDDAIAPSKRLDRLISIAGDIPLALAIIPAAAEPELATWVVRPMHSAALAVLQHGWRHASHSTLGKKSEFPAERPCAEVASDLIAGRARMTALFGPRALAVLVPPWNRFDGSFLPLLATCGLRAISRVKPRPAASPTPGILEVNVHVDLIAWADDRDFIGEGAALGRLIEHLRYRRLSEFCVDEPTGILTHHLVQDEATDAFLHRLCVVTGAHPAARWLDPAEIFAPAHSRTG